MSIGKENKLHIGIYGRINVGKSSLINNLLGQDVAIVSDMKGTTTDPVRRSFELTGFASIIFIDTAGIDDIGAIGSLRIEKTYNTINKIDLGILVISENNFGECEELLIAEFNKFNIPYFIVFNKYDLIPSSEVLNKEVYKKYKTKLINYSTNSNYDKNIIFSEIKKILSDSSSKTHSLLEGLVKPKDLVLLITPIDNGAPNGRLILPQVQTIRDILDNNCIAIVLKENEVSTFLENTKTIPKLAITDSQIFSKADAIVPKNIPLTSFSILLARYKGDFKNYLLGTPKISELKNNDKILILESCSHHASCEDIGRVKIPNLLNKFTGKTLEYTIVSGLDNVPGNISDYTLIVQCGGCVLTRKQIASRLLPAIDAGIPVTNYGMLIAYVQGIYKRAVQIFT